MNSAAQPVRQATPNANAAPTLDQSALLQSSQHTADQNVQAHSAKQPSTRPSSAWKHHAERSHVLIIRFMVGLSLLLGRRLSRIVVYGIALYYFVFGGAARRASHDYLDRVLGRKATAFDGYKHILSFATVVHDRIFLLKNRFQLFDIRVSGEAPFNADRARGVPLLLIGGHLGSFEVLRAVGQNHGCNISMLMYLENAAKLNASLAAIADEPIPRVIALQRVDAMLTAQDDLLSGQVLGMLADRSLGKEPTDVLDFLGAPALFPRNPFRLASILGCKVYFMTGLYRGANRYEVFLEPLADFSDSTINLPATRGQRVALAQQRYVALLETYCRQAPYNWYNFFDFWQSHSKNSP